MNERVQYPVNPDGNWGIYFANMSRDLNGMYDTLKEMYRGYVQPRWITTPPIEATRRKYNLPTPKKLDREEKVKFPEESIFLHVLSTQRVWYSLRRIFPSLNVISPLDVFETLLTHDDGEIFDGDTTLDYQLSNGKSHKISERNSFLRVYALAPLQVQRDAIGSYDQFETEIERIENPSILMAQVCDALQGNHFLLTFGTDIPDYQNRFNAIQKLKLVPAARELIRTFVASNQLEATDAILYTVFDQQYRAGQAGMPFDLSEFTQFDFPMGDYYYV